MIELKDVEKYSINKLTDNEILPEKSYFKAMAGCSVRGYMNTAIKIFTDKVNKENYELAWNEFKDFMIPNEKIHSMKNI